MTTQPLRWLEKAITSNLPQFKSSSAAAVLLYSPNLFPAVLPLKPTLLLDTFPVGLVSRPEWIIFSF